MSNARIRYGVLPPVTGDWQDDPPAFVRHLLDTAARVEDLGFDSFWASDSLLRARVEPLTLLGHVAARTTGLTLGTAALIPAWRQPVAAAQTIASLDLLSAGRLVLGVGSGFPVRSDREFALSGIPPGRRPARLDDIVALWRQLWSESTSTSFHGEVLAFEELPNRYRTHRVEGPPIWLAAGTPSALRRVGERYDGWLPYPPDPATYAQGLAAAQTAAARAGRAAPTAALFVTIAVAASPSAGRTVLDDYCRASYGAPLEYVETVQAFIAGPAEHVQTELNRYVEAGARHIIIRLPAQRAAEQTEQLEQLAAAVTG